MNVNQQIEQLRKLLGPTPVIDGDVPKWFIKRWIKRFGPGETSHILNDVRRFIHAQIGSCDILDHYGSTTLRNGKVAFVTEPYGVSRDMHDAMAAVAAELKCDCQIEVNSWWYPGHTIRGRWFEGDWKTEPIEAIERRSLFG